MSEQISSSAPAVTWTVTGQQERTIIGAGSQPVQVVTVFFTLPNGTQGSVDVPQSSYGIDSVRAAISAKAATMQAVADLTQ